MNLLHLCITRHCRKHWNHVCRWWGMLQPPCLDQMWIIWTCWMLGQNKGSGLCIFASLISGQFIIYFLLFFLNGAIHWWKRAHIYGNVLLTAVSSYSNRYLKHLWGACRNMFRIHVCWAAICKYIHTCMYKMLGTQFVFIKVLVMILLTTCIIYCYQLHTVLLLLCTLST